MTVFETVLQLSDIARLRTPQRTRDLAGVQSDQPAKPRGQPTGQPAWQSADRPRTENVRPGSRSTPPPGSCSGGPHSSPPSPRTRPPRRAVVHMRGLALSAVLYRDGPRPCVRCGGPAEVALDGETGLLPVHQDCLALMLGPDGTVDVYMPHAPPRSVHVLGALASKRAAYAAHMTRLEMLL